MRLHYDTDPNAMHDELRVDIMRTIPGKILEMYAIIPAPIAV